jgi:predicted PurR-regulated permease PerM
VKGADLPRGGVRLVRPRVVTERPVSEPQRALYRFIVFAGIALGVACLYWARIVLVPIAVAMLGTFLLSPLVSQVQRTRLPRVPAVMLVVALALALAVGLGWVLLSQVTSFANDLPKYRQTITRKINDLQQMRHGGTLEQVETTAKDVLKQIDKGAPQAEKPVPVVVSPPNPLWSLPNVVHPITTAFMVLVLVIFMLVQQRELIARIIRLFGYERMAATTRLLDEAGTRISRYLLTQSIINGSFGLGIGIGLAVIGLPFALALGSLAAILRFLPYVGPWLALLAPLTLSLAVFDGWTRPLLILGLFIVIEFTVAFVIEPLLYGRSAGVSAIALLVGAGFWTWLWGPIGLALAVPLTVCLVVASRAVAGLEFIEVLMSDDPPVEPCLTFYQRLLAGDAREAAAVIAETARRVPLEEVFDAIVAPAIARARHDRGNDQLTREEYGHMLTMVRELIEEAPTEAPRAETAEDGPTPLRAQIAGCAARDEVDGLGLLMLGRLLADDGCALHLAPPGGLIGEAVAAVDAAPPALVCVAAVGNGGRRRMRHLVKRLRQSHPDTPILAARWGAGNTSALRADLAEIGADDLVTSLAEARAEILRLLPSDDINPSGPRPMAGAATEVAS